MLGGLILGVFISEALTVIVWRYIEDKRNEKSDSDADDTFESKIETIHFEEE